MRMFDIISKKKYNESLSKEEIDYVINEYTNGTIPDYQMSALLIAIYFNGMNYEETTNLTLASLSMPLNRLYLNSLATDRNNLLKKGLKKSLLILFIF